MIAVQEYDLNDYNRVVENELPVYIYVKFVYQTINTSYQMPRNIPVYEMVRKMREYILNDFNLPETHYEIVEAGQNLPFGTRSEEAPALVVNNKTIQDRFNNQNCISFYIRPVQEPIAVEVYEPPQCMVCQEAESPQLRLTNYFRCIHFICDGCCAGCLEAGIDRCAICRCVRRN